MDKLVRATAKGGQVRIIAAITTDLVNEGVSNASMCAYCSSSIR